MTPMMLHSSKITMVDGGRQQHAKKEMMFSLDKRKWLK